jgi:hypothetical protein
MSEVWYGAWQLGSEPGGVPLRTGWRRQRGAKAGLECCFGRICFAAESSDCLNVWLRLVFCFI